MAAAGSTFSAVTRGTMVRWSFDGKRVACIASKTLYVFDGLTAALEAKWSMPDGVRSLSWSPSGDKDGPAYHIDDPAGGIVASAWAPDGAHILTWTDYGLKAVMWFVEGKAGPVGQFLNAKVWNEKDALGGDKPVFACSTSSNLAAMVERTEGKDTVALYSLPDWLPLRRVPLTTLEAVGVEWSPDGRHVAVIENPVPYGVHIVGLDWNVHILTACENELGVRCVQWSPTNRLLAVGSYDNTIRLFESTHWQLACALASPTTTVSPSARCKVFVEAQLINNQRASSLSEYMVAHAGATSFSIEQHSRGTFTLQGQPSANANKAAVMRGITSVAFSPDGRFLLSRSESTPFAVFVWDLSLPRMCAVFLFTQPVRAAAWCPEGLPLLAMSCGTTAVHTWSLLHGAVSHQLPQADFETLGLTWSPAGDGLLVHGRDNWTTLSLKRDAETVETNA